MVGVGSRFVTNGATTLKPFINGQWRTVTIRKPNGANAPLTASTMTRDIPPKIAAGQPWQIKTKTNEPETVTK